MKRNSTVIKIVALVLVWVVVVSSTGIENVKAFWNQNGTSREDTQITIQFMHCYYKDKHYDIYGSHRLEYVKEDEDTQKAVNGKTSIQVIDIKPGINQDKQAGIESDDMVKYFYEYELNYSEGDDIDYAVITQPYITHYSEEEANKNGVTESHNRMYWVGEYSGTITNIKDAYIENPNDKGHAIPGVNGVIDWFDFKGVGYPTINNSLSQQTWEIVENMANQDARQFVMNPDIGDDDANGQRFIYLIEGTFFNKDMKDANHADNNSIGIPDYYGTHIMALIGLVFYRSVDFNANGGALADGSTLKMKVYNGSSKSRLYTWYNDKSKREWYSDINVKYPTDNAGNVYIKPPIKTGYSFLGWYAPEINSEGEYIYNSDGTIKLSDVPVYDVNGKAVTSYTDSSGKKQVSPYFDSNGRWIYKGNVTAVAKWEYIGKYTLHYDKGESSNMSLTVPNDTTVTLGNKITVADGTSPEYRMTGSDYTVAFVTQTDCENVFANTAEAIKGDFGYSGWVIFDKLYKGKGVTLSKVDAKDGDIYTAVARYDDATIKLPSVTCDGYELEGWYSAWDKNTKTFNEKDRIGGAGDRYTIKTSRNSVYKSMYAHWLKSSTVIYFDANKCDTCNKRGTTEQKDVTATVGKYSTSVASVKNGTVNELHKFTGWYDSDGVQVYDSAGNAVTSSTKYWTKDYSGRAVWNYRNDVILYAHYSEGYYTVHYDKGETSGDVDMPDDITASLGSSLKLCDAREYYGSEYTVHFDTNVEKDTTSYPDAVSNIYGHFMWRYWSIDNKAYGENGNNLIYYKPNAVHKEVVTATAVYKDAEIILPKTARNGYDFKGWYAESACKNFIGNAGDKVTIGKSSNNVDITYYAKWEPSDATVAFDYNVPSKATKSSLGKDTKFVLSGDDVKSKTVTYFNSLGALPAPKLAGYILEVSSSSDGWSKMPNLSNGTQVCVPVTSETKYDGSYKILYAQWSPVRYNIKYELNGGSLSKSNPTEANYYDEIVIYSPTKEGSTFLGWEITGMDGYRHSISGQITNTGVAKTSGVGKGLSYVNVAGLRGDTGTVTFTAKWQNTSYSISYDYKDADTKARLTPVSKADNPTSYDISTATFTLKNSDVKGYYDPMWGGTGISGTIPTVTIEQGSTGNRSYTAYYSPIEYEIVYDLSGGSWGNNASHPNTAKYNRSFTVSNPVMSGCTFDGWEITRMCDDCEHIVGGTSKTDSSSSNVKGTSFMNLRCDSSEKVVFTARWNRVRYNIRYELNGGSYYSGGKYPTSAETYSTIDINNPVRTGYTFAGWTISGMDSGLHYLPSGDTNAGTKSGVGSGKNEGASLSYGYLRYSNGTVTFKAAWVQEARQVAFFGNDGTMSGASIHDEWTLRFINFGGGAFFSKYEYDTNWGVDIPKVSKTGYTFNGYYDSLSEGNQVYSGSYSKTAGQYWDSNGKWIGPSLIVYAHFVPNNYTVTFNTNGGVWSSDNSKNNRTLGVTYDSTKNNKAYGKSDLYRPGYTFEGWSTEPNGAGYTVYDIDGYSTNEGGYWSENYRK